MMRPMPILAALLSLSAPGLGHLYLGLDGRALAIQLTWIGLLYASCAATLGSFRGLLWTVGVSLVFLAAVAVNAWRSALRVKGIQARVWWYLLPAALLLNVGVEPVLLASIAPSARYGGFRFVSESMHPSLEEGEKVMVDRAWYRHHAPRKMDLLVFAPPTDPESLWVMRCVGLPGDQIQFLEGRCFLNGVTLDAPAPSGASPVPVHVPPDHVYCLGDNRNNSLDSRYWGPLPVANIRGRALYVYGSRTISRWGSRL
jgi:signal peptidase I